MNTHNGLDLPWESVLLTHPLPVAENVSSLVFLESFFQCESVGARSFWSHHFEILWSQLQPPVVVVATWSDSTNDWHKQWGSWTDDSHRRWEWGRMRVSTSPLHWVWPGSCMRRGALASCSACQGPWLMTRRPCFLPLLPHRSHCSQSSFS